MSLVILNIKDKAEFSERKDFILMQDDIFGIELFVSLILDLYIYGELEISEMSKQEIYDICIDISCEQIQKGAVDSKFKLAEELLKTDNLYMKPDRSLAHFLIHLASCENSSGSRGYLSDYYYSLNRDDLGGFWLRKNLTNHVKKCGESLPLTFNKEERKLELNSKIDVDEIIKIRDSDI